MNALMLYIPPKVDSAGFEYGGPMCIKTGSLQAYVAFASVALATEFRARWNIDNSVLTIHASDLGTKYRVILSDIGVAVLFPKMYVLETFFKDPQSFPCEKYFVKLASVRGTWLQRIFCRH